MTETGMPGRGVGEVDHVFVYGTLKRGECRAAQWPVRPQAIRPAWTLGALFDLGPYPALIAGNDRVRGELWTFHGGEMASVLQTLDEVEGTNQPGQPNLYDRVITAVHLLGPPADQPLVCDAYTYYYADQHRLASAIRLAASSTENGGFVVWPPHATGP